jgi:hypothetical protein
MHDDQILHSGDFKDYSFDIKIQKNNNEDVEKIREKKVVGIYILSEYYYSIGFVDSIYFRAEVLPYLEDKIKCY